jgi:hydroxyacylglutathione hydrolase
MIFHRFYDPQLAQASFLIGCSATGEGLVIDPSRRIEPYLTEAEQAGLRITAVTETHIHADFVSGSRELAARSGATLYLSDAGGADWRYRYAADAGAVLLTEGSQIQVGQVRIDVLHTPGHTPEHLSFMVTDTAAAEGPVGIVTGDFVFAGDVGRPDLLEKAVGVANAADGAARVLYHSLQRFRTLPEHLQVWPGHGAGSACGKGLSAMPQSTVGYELRYNWAFQARDEQEFVDAVLSGQPEPPRYFKEMKRINRDGPPILGSPTVPRWLPEHYLKERLAAGDMVVDLRPAAEFAAGHVAGTINIPLNRSFTSWAGWLLPYDRPFYLLADSTGAAGIQRVANDLTMIGLESIGGYFGPEALQGELQAAEQVSLDEVKDAKGKPYVLDVRNLNEWEHGHLPGAHHIALGTLPDRLQEIPRDQPIVVHCQGGGRSAIAQSILQAAGYTDVRNMGAGFGGWSAAGLPVASREKRKGEGGGIG